MTASGNPRGFPVYHKQDRQGFLGRGAALPERLGIHGHAFVRMDNHFHLPLRTPEPNLSQAIQWLNVSYGTRLIRAHRLFGHVFQGRFQAKLIGGVQRRNSTLSLPQFTESDR